MKTKHEIAAMRRLFAALSEIPAAAQPEEGASPDEKIVHADRFAEEANWDSTQEPLLAYGATRESRSPSALMQAALQRARSRPVRLGEIVELPPAAAAWRERDIFSLQDGRAEFTIPEGLIVCQDGVHYLAGEQLVLDVTLLRQAAVRAEMSPEGTVVLVLESAK